MTRVLPVPRTRPHAPRSWCAAFSRRSPRAFLDPANLVNIVVQSASVGIVATGMTFVLLTAGVDLSVGAVMFVSAAVAGKLALAGAPLPAVFGAILAIGALCGAVNAFFVTRAGVKAVRRRRSRRSTSAAGSACGSPRPGRSTCPRRSCRSGAPASSARPSLRSSSASSWSPLTSCSTRTPFGRHVYAVGHDADAARRAGLPVGPDPLRGVRDERRPRGARGGGGGRAARSGVAARSAGSGSSRAIAAAVLGGVSLFGGRGTVLPGVLLGALLVQTVENGLVIVNADPYLYPLVIACVIFVAVLLDSARGARRRDSR